MGYNVVNSKVFIIASLDNHWRESQKEISLAGYVPKYQ